MENNAAVAGKQMLQAASTTRTHAKDTPPLNKIKTINFYISGLSTQTGTLEHSAKIVRIRKS